MKVPKEFVVCPQSFFPFKLEIVEMIGSMKDYNDTSKIGASSQGYGILLLTYELLYEFWSNKTFINNYIEKHDELSIYKNNSINVDPSFKYSFPDIFLGKVSNEAEHSQLLRDKNYNFDSDLEKLGHVFREMQVKIAQSKHYEALVSFTNNFDNFIKAYGSVVSRAMSMKLNEYYTLIGGFRKNDEYYTEAERKNKKINSLICHSGGCPCIVGFVDLCNHYQPSSEKDKKKTMRQITATPMKDYVLNFSPIDYEMGEEYMFQYVKEPNNFALFLNYGFIIPQNAYNQVEIRIDEKFEFTKSQKALYRNLTTYNNKKFESQTNSTKLIYSLYFDVQNDALINYQRVKNLKPEKFKSDEEIDESEEKEIEKHYIKKLKNKLANGRIISFQNELDAWCGYVMVIRNAYTRVQKPKLIDSLKKGQIYRKKKREIEDQWKDDETQRLKWRKFKQFDLIYDMTISYDRIFVNHLIMGHKNIIKNVNTNIKEMMRYKINQLN